MILPAIFPAMRSTILLSLGAGWGAVLGAEYLGAQSGLGFIIVYAAAVRLSRPHVLHCAPVHPLHLGQLLGDQRLARANGATVAAGVRRTGWTDLLERSAVSLVADLRSGALSAVDLATACLDRIATLEPDIRAWAHLDRNMALEQAQAADARRASGHPLGPLHGLPVAVKDIIDTADLPTEYNSPIYRGWQAAEGCNPRAATPIDRRDRHGQDRDVGVRGLFGRTDGNPHDLSRTPGGSSSGSAAAIAARMVPLALATQTNGSTIRPASFCGVVGFKPSLGVLPGPALEQSTMLDQPGLMARDVFGVALLADALGGFIR